MKNEEAARLHEAYEAALKANSELKQHCNKLAAQLNHLLASSQDLGTPSHTGESNIRQHPQRASEELPELTPRQNPWA